MPLFARRRLQHMLDDLSVHLSGEKGRDLLNRLEDKRVEQALPAEMELALLWALSGLGDLDVEPEWWGDDCRPDAYTEALIPNVPVAIEIAAPNDNAISGEAAMDAIALAMSDHANVVRKKSGSHLYFRFQTESGYENNEYFRRRLAPLDYSLTEGAKSKIKDWISLGDSAPTRLRIIEQGLDVEIERTDHKQTRYHNIWSSMPAETHSLEDNPLFDLLRRKLRQLKAAHPGTKRFIFLADVGSTLLNRLGQVGEIDPTRRRVSGREIIHHFISKYRDRIDAVIVFAPRRESSAMGMRSIKWSVVGFGNALTDSVPSGLDAVVRRLPSPRYEGYQVRSLFRQGVFSIKSRGQYLGMTINSNNKGSLQVRVPARVIVDLLAERITAEQFRYFMGERGDQKNLFQHWLDMGKNIKRIEMADRNVDEDDDHIIIHFDDDPAVRKLKLKE